VLLPTIADDRRGMVDTQAVTNAASPRSSALEGGSGAREPGLGSGRHADPDLCLPASHRACGVALNTLVGWWWADPIAALAMVPIVVKEGLEGFGAEADCVTVTDVARFRMRRSLVRNA
jgi:hypothetical protein